MSQAQSTRADLVAEKVATAELDALLVTDLVNIRWLTGYAGSNAAVVIGSGEGGFRRFLTDFRYLTVTAGLEADGWERAIATDLLERAVSDFDGAELRLGFDDAHMSVKEHAKLESLAGERIELVAAGGVVEELRAVKDEAELVKLRAATRLADDALTDTLSRGLAGRTEKDFALDLEFTMRRMGAEAVSFPPIVAGGEHGALPHAEPRDVVIGERTLVVVDWGAQLDGYASDCTRTYATGDLDPRDEEIYEIVLEAQLAALAAIRPGLTGREVDAVAREIIDAAGHAEHFGHGLGHGVGLEVHEGPRLSKQGEAELRPGNVVTVEPGVYMPGAVGVRIEDLVVVTPDGCEVLTSLPKDLQIV